MLVFSVLHAIIAHTLFVYQATMINKF